MRGRLACQGFGAALQLGAATHLADAQVVAAVVDDDFVLAITLDRHVAAVGLVLPGFILATDLAADGALGVDPHVAELGGLGVVQVFGHLFVHAFDLVLTARQGEHCHYHSQFAHACTSRFEGADSSTPSPGKDRDHTLHRATSGHAPQAVMACLALS
ncbi:hypothetical protein D3C71_1507500 [compost metagenome]